MDCSPDVLLQAARCYDCTIPPGSQPSVRSYLLCQWANKSTCDPDALAFIAAAGINDPTQISAICKLVLDLKTFGTPNYWSREVIIYPFVGGTAASHSINLVNPATFTLNYFGSCALAAAHNANGMVGDGATGYAAAGIIPSNLPAINPSITSNNLRVMCYMDTDAMVNAKAYFGVVKTSAPVSRITLLRATGGGIIPLDCYHDDNTDWFPYNLPNVQYPGIKVLQRYSGDANPKQAVTAPFLVFQKINTAAVSLPNLQIYILARNNGGAASLWSLDRISGWSIGLPFVSDAEYVQYKGIWDTFETALGRGHP